MVVKKKSIRRLATHNAAISNADKSSNLVRTKYWSEINNTERIERVRNSANSMVRTLERLTAEIETLKAIVWDHSHEQDGSVVVKVKKERRHRLEERGVSDVRIKHFPSAENKSEDDVYI